MIIQVNFVIDGLPAAVTCAQSCYIDNTPNKMIHIAQLNSYIKFIALCTKHKLDCICVKVPFFNMTTKHRKLRLEFRDMLPQKNTVTKGRFINPTDRFVHFVMTLH